MTAPETSPLNTRLPAGVSGPRRNTLEPLIFNGTGSGGVSPDEARRPAEPNSPITTIGFSPRYLSVHSRSLAPSLLTIARYEDRKSTRLKSHSDLVCRLLL